VRGDSTNDLIAFVADPNVMIQESKALTGDIRPGRKAVRYRVTPELPELDDPRDTLGLRPYTHKPSQHEPEKE
jgi:formate dehydrogenase major subunit